MLQGLPLSTIAVVGALVLVTTFFVTSSDSGSLVVDMLASGGNPEPPTWSRVFWAVTEGVVAATLIVAGAASGSGGSTGALDALRAASITIALPFTVILVAGAVATYKDLHAAVRREEQAERLRRTAAMVAVVMRSRDNGSGQVTLGVPVSDLTEHGPTPDDLRTGDVVSADGAPRQESGSPGR